MNTVLIVVGSIAGALVLLVTGLLVIARIGTPGSDEMKLGLSDGRFEPCPSSPNCVTTMAADDAHQVERIPFAGTRGRALQAALGAINSLDRVQIIEQKPSYIWAEVRSFLFRYIDDVEIYLPENGSVVHFRSASRAGFGDMGVNRRRYNQFKAAFLSELE